MRSLRYERKTDWYGEVTETAEHFKITRTKVTKMLVTSGVYSTPMTRGIQKLRAKGMSVKEIAAELGCSTGTVSSYLPYTTEFHGTAEPTKHAKEVREYRAYEKKQKERQVQERKEERMEDWKKDLDSKLSFTVTDSRRPRMTWEMAQRSPELAYAKSALEASGIELPAEEDRREELRGKGDLTPDEVLDLGEFPGALYDRNVHDLEELYGEELPYEPREMMRLHLELVADFSEREKKVMHKYGSMAGDTISRDVLVSDDLPLYALHYVIQRAFGWQNSHLHRFYISDERIAEFTKNAETWLQQVGVIYRSPLMDENAEFWADDYERGSFKNWLRKKYTGPCVSQCWAEGLKSCRADMDHIDLDAEYYVEYGYYKADRRYEPGYEGNGELDPDDAADAGKVRLLRCRPVYNWKGEKNDPPEADEFVHGFRVEVVKMRDLPVEMMNRLFERGAFDILERLSIGEVLAVRNMSLADSFQDGEQVSGYQEMLDDGMDDEIEGILEGDLDSPMKQPFVYSFTDELLYNYDFGDNWKIRITGSRNCSDLVESGRITQDMLDKSNIKARVTYRPVLLSRDGEMLIDDVGGTSGMVGFIEAINTMGRGEHDENGMSRTELKEWAKSQGWHKDDSTDFNLL